MGTARGRNVLRWTGHALAAWAVVSWPVGWVWAGAWLSPYTPPANGVLPNGPPGHLERICLLPADLSVLGGLVLGAVALAGGRWLAVLEGGLAIASGIALHVMLFFLVEMAF